MLGLGPIGVSAGAASGGDRGGYRGRQRGTTKAQPRRARELRGRGLKVQEIATALGVSRRTAFPTDGPRSGFRSPAIPGAFPEHPSFCEPDALRRPGHPRSVDLDLPILLDVEMEPVRAPGDLDPDPEVSASPISLGNHVLVDPATRVGVRVLVCPSAAPSWRVSRFAFIGSFGLSSFLVSSPLPIGVGIQPDDPHLVKTNQRPIVRAVGGEREFAGRLGAWSSPAALRFPWWRRA